MIKTILNVILNQVILHLATFQYPIQTIHAVRPVLIRIGSPDFSTSSLQFELLHSRYPEQRFVRRFTERFVSGKFTGWMVYTSTGLRMWFVDVFASRTVSTPISLMNTTNCVCRP